MRARARLSAVIVVGLLSAAPGRAQSSVATSTAIGLDHVPIAVANLEAAATRYRALGFALKPGTPHANGIRNVHAKFRDFSELELITAASATDALTTTYRTHLSKGDGPAFLALYWRRPSFTSTLSYIFFGPRNESPTDKPEYFEHANGAEALVSVWLAGDDLSAERQLLERAGATLARRVVEVPGREDATVASFSEGDVVLLPGSHQLVRGRPIIGASVRVRNIDAAMLAIQADLRSAVRRLTTSRGQSAILPPSIGHGLWLEFCECRRRP